MVKIEPQKKRIEQICLTGKSVAAERFIRTFKNKIYKHLTAGSKNLYFDFLDGIVNKYNNPYYRIIMKPIDIKPDSYAEYNVDSNEKDPKFQADSHVRISKYKRVFAKGFTPNWSEVVFVISKIKNTVPVLFQKNVLDGEEIIETLYENESRRT